MAEWVVLFVVFQIIIKAGGMAIQLLTPQIL